MTGNRTLFAILISAVVASGAMVASSSNGDAAPSVPAPPLPAPPPVAPHAPKAPRAPKAPKAPDVGDAALAGAISIAIRGARTVVDEKLAESRAQIASEQNIPPAVKAAVLRRLDEAKRMADQRMANFHASSMDDFGAQMDAIGNDIGAMMEGLGADMDKLAPQLEHLGSELGDGKRGFSFHFSHDDDDDNADNNDPPEPPEPAEADDDSDSEVGNAPTSVPSIGNTPGSMSVNVDHYDVTMDPAALKLKPAQRDALRLVLADEQHIVEPASARLEIESRHLQDTLAAKVVDEAAAARFVDAMSAEEATIRRAKVAAWAKAKKILDDEQRTLLNQSVHQVHSRSSH